MLGKQEDVVLAKLAHAVMEYVMPNFGVLLQGATMNGVAAADGVFGRVRRAATGFIDGCAELLSEVKVERRSGAVGAVSHDRAAAPSTAGGLRVARRRAGPSAAEAGSNSARSSVPLPSVSRLSKSSARADAAKTAARRHRRGTIETARLRGTVETAIGS